jgi:hypothetical protein
LNDEEFRENAAKVASVSWRGRTVSRFESRPWWLALRIAAGLSLTAGVVVMAARLGWYLAQPDEFSAFKRPWRVFFWLVVPSFAAIGFALGAFTVWREQLRVVLTVLAVVAALVALWTTRWSAGGYLFYD